MTHSPVPLVALVGKSGSGKTTLMEKLLKILTARGIRVGTVKHDAHSFDVDHPGKDTWRHREAGACAVAILSPTRMFLTVDAPERNSVREVVETHLSGLGLDLVIAEGFKRGDTEKIEVQRAARSDALICSGPGDRLVAIASDMQWNLGVPLFHVDDAEGIADFIVDRYLPGRR